MSPVTTGTSPPTLWVTHRSRTKRVNETPPVTLAGRREGVGVVVPWSSTGKEVDGRWVFLTVSEKLPLNSCSHFNQNKKDHCFGRRTPEDVYGRKTPPTVSHTELDRLEGYRLPTPEPSTRPAMVVTDPNLVGPEPATENRRHLRRRSRCMTPTNLNAGALD